MARASVLVENKHYRRGITLLDQGQYRLAAGEFEQVLAEVDSSDPTARLARFHLGAARAQSGLELLHRRAPDRAEEEIRRALAINPDYADLHYHLARALSGRNKPEEALAELDAAIGINPAFAKAYFERGIMLYRAGDFDTGLAEIGRAVEIDDAYSRELYESALALHRNRKPFEALERLLDLAATNLDDIEYHFQLGKDSYRKGGYEQAIAEFRKALGIQSRYADIRNYLGLALLAAGHAEEALEEFETAIEINPNFAAAMANAGDACAAVGDKAQAAEHYQAALKLDPNQTGAAEKLQQLG